MTELEKAIEENYWERHRSFVRTHVRLERIRMNAFDAQGKIDGYDGEITLKRILFYFQELEMYEWCVFVRDLIKEYEQKFKNNQRETGSGNHTA
jgi:hypothetical protein